MYDKEIMELQQIINNYFARQKIKFKPPQIVTIPNTLFASIKGKLDKTAWILRAIDKNEDMQKILKNRNEYTIIFNRVELSMKQVLGCIHINNEGNFIVHTSIIPALLSLSYNIAQLGGLADGANYQQILDELKAESLTDPKVYNMKQSNSTTTTDSIYVIDE